MRTAANTAQDVLNMAESSVALSPEFRNWEYITKAIALPVRIIIDGGFGAAPLIALPAGTIGLSGLLGDQRAYPAWLRHSIRFSGTGCNGRDAPCAPFTSRGSPG